MTKLSDAGFAPRAINITDRARLYLRCIDDWKAPYEIAALLGDNPPPSVAEVTRMLGRLANRGLVYHSRANNTYRVTIAGRDAVGAAVPGRQFDPDASGHVQSVPRSWLAEKLA